MKKLSLVLALVMLASCLFGVSAIAEGDTETATYKDVTITYSNVSYADEMALMFAVPVPTDLPEGAKVSVVVWEDYDATEAFSYSDVESATSSAVELSPEAQTVAIGGVQHYVYKYFGLNASMMTDVVYARSVVVDGDARYYGEIINKSVVEYAKTALGDIEGYAGLADENKKNLIKSLLNFGAMAQIYLGDEGETYAPNGYLANDTLNKIWIVPVIDGVEQEKLLGGFFKAGADSYATLYPEFYDLLSVVGWVDGEGNALADADGSDNNGFQVEAPAEGDLEVKLVYSRKMVFDSTIENADFGEFFQNSGASTMHQTTASQRVPMVPANLAGNSGFGPNPGQVDKNGACTAKNCYAGYKVIEDPHKPGSGEKVLLWTGTDNGALYMDGNNSPIQIRSRVAGIGDTIDPVFTIDFTIAGGELAVGSTANFRIRSDYLKEATGKGTSQCNLNIFKVSGGKVQIATSDSNYVDLCELSTTSYTRFVITIDFAAETIRGYVADENGELKLVVEETKRTRPAAMAKAVAVVDESGNPRNVGYDSLYNWLMNAQSKVEWYGGGGSALSNDQLKTLTVDIDGVQTPLADANGVINEAAFIKWHELNESLIIKDVKMYAGEVE